MTTSYLYHSLKRASFLLKIAFGFFSFFLLLSVLPAHAAGPVITSIYPTSGPVGTRITITGSGFAPGSMVGFGPGVALLDADSPTSTTKLIFTIPASVIPKCRLTDTPCTDSFFSVFPATYAINVATDSSFNTVSNNVNFTITPSTIITSVSVSAGQIGTQVTIYGRGFSSFANGINLDSGSQQGTIVQLSNSTSVIKFAIPKMIFPRCAVTLPTPCTASLYQPTPGSYSLSVTPNLDYNQTSNQLPFTLLSGAVTLPGPVITSISPTSGTIGTQVTIKGSGFSPNLNLINFGIGLGAPKLTAPDTLVFDIPDALAPICILNNPPCQPTGPISMIPGTYNVSVSLDAATMSNSLTFTVKPIPIPTSTPIVATAATSSEVEAAATINVRTDPSLTSPIEGTEAPNSLGFVADGPVIADGYNWVKVLWQDGTFGWSVENYLIVPGLSSCPISNGDTAYIIAGGQAVSLFLRSNPSINATITGGELDGTKGTIISGPVLADGHNWWQLQFPDGVLGWAPDSSFTDANCFSATTPASSTSQQSLSLTFATPQQSATVSGQVPVTVTVNSSFPVTGVDFYIDGTLFNTIASAPYTLSWDATKILNGSHTIKAIANTNSGISATNSITVNVTGGLTLPVVTFATPQQSATVSGQVPVTVTVNSSFPVTGVNFFADGTLIGKATSAPYTVSWDATKVYNGMHSLTATVTALNGQTNVFGTKTISVNVTGGLQRPQIPVVIFVTPQQSATVSGQVPVTVTVSSSVPATGVTFYIDGKTIGTATVSPYTVSFDATQLLNGWHTINAIATANGISGGRSITVNVTGGLTLPVVTFATPQPSATVSGQVPVTVTVPANNPAVTEVDFYLDGALIGTAASAPYTVSFDATKLYNGTHSLQATARTARTDISGSKGIIITVTGGLAHPTATVTITSPQDNSTIFGSVPVSASVSSNAIVSEIDFYANGKLLGAAKTSPYNSIWDTTQSAPGTYTLLAVAKASGTSASNSVTENVIPVPIFSVGERVAAQTDSNVGLNARSGPSTSNSITGTEANQALGTILNSIPVFANTYNWWQVQWDNGVTGWSVETYLVKAP